MGVLSLERFFDRKRISNDFLLFFCATFKISVLSEDKIVLSICASLHRKAAFEANEFIMDHLKTKATFWKSEVSNEKKYWVKEKLSDKNALKRWKNVKT